MTTWRQWWQSIPVADRWASVDLETLPADVWPIVLYDCVGEEGLLAFAAFAYGDSETCPRHPNRTVPCECERGADVASYCDGDVATTRVNDDKLTGVSFAVRQARLGEVMGLVLRERAGVVG